MTFAEEIGQHTAVGDRDLVRSVGHEKADLAIGAALDAPRGYETAQPEGFSGFDRAREEIARGKEKRDFFAQCCEHEGCRTPT